VCEGVYVFNISTFDRKKEVILVVILGIRCQ
jgi:hypothetical protein